LLFAIFIKKRGVFWRRLGGSGGETGRYTARPSLEEIFEGKEADEGIYEAVYP